MEKFICLGGMIIDMKGIYFHDLNKDNKTGRIRYQMGGIARNLAQFLATFDKEVYLISAYGDDDLGRALKEHTIKANIRLDYSKEFHGATTTTYIAVFDSKNHSILSICDNELVSGLSEFDLKQALLHFDKSDYYVLDNNLSIHQIHVILKEVQKTYFVPIFEKALMPYQSLFPQFSLILFDGYHIKECSGLSVENASDFKKASQELLKMGVQSALMIVDCVGIAYMNQENFYLCTCEEFMTIVSKDAHEFLMASFLFVLAEHLPIEKVLEYAMSAIVLENEIKNEAEHVITQTKIIEKIQEIRPKVKKECYDVSEMH